MSKNTSVTLGEHFEQIIEKSIQSGRYASASEVIREGLRLVDEREQKIKILREAITALNKSASPYPAIKKLQRKCGEAEKIFFYKL